MAPTTSVCLSHKLAIRDYIYFMTHTLRKGDFQLLVLCLGTLPSVLHYSVFYMRLDPFKVVVCLVLHVMGICWNAPSLLAGAQSSGNIERFLLLEY